jgi:hypothetical protein
MNQPITDSKGVLTTEGGEDIIKRASMFECECPKHLVGIFNHIRKFTDYEKNCLNLSPKDVITHEWLLSQAEELELRVSSLIVKLSRAEKMIDDNNRVIDEK